jgi:hypothetical protein
VYAICRALGCIHAPHLDRRSVAVQRWSNAKQ